MASQDTQTNSDVLSKYVSNNNVRKSVAGPEPYASWIPGEQKPGIKRKA